MGTMAEPSSQIKLPTKEYSSNNIPLSPESIYPVKNKNKHLTPTSLPTALFLYPIQTKIPWWCEFLYSYSFSHVSWAFAPMLVGLLLPTLHQNCFIPRLLIPHVGESKGQPPGLLHFMRVWHQLSLSPHSQATHNNTVTWLSSFQGLATPSQCLVLPLSHLCDLMWRSPAMGLGPFLYIKLLLWWAHLIAWSSVSMLTTPQCTFSAETSSWTLDVS